MSSKINYLFSSLSVLMLVMFALQMMNVNRIEKALDENIKAQRVLDNYILSTFSLDSSLSKEKVAEICRPHLKDSSYVLYLPAGLCRACFSSLLFAFQDHGISGETITVISGQEDFEVKAECLARGIHYMVNTEKVESISDILLFRLYQGFLPVVLSYNLGRDKVLSLFLSDNDRLLQILSGAD
jgi:hypothetical protein